MLLQKYDELLFKLLQKTNELLFILLQKLDELMQLHWCCSYLCIAFRLSLAVLMSYYLLGPTQVVKHNK